MKHSILVLSLIATLLYGCEPNKTANTETKPEIKLTVPQGWYIAGSGPQYYDMGLDEKGGMNNGKAATIRSVQDTVSIKQFGTLMQSMPPDSFAGKKIKMSGYMKSSNVTGWSGLWLRIDLKNNEQGDFDNMQNRPVKGTTDWQKFDIVLHVDPIATNIAYGALLSGSGQIWFDQLKFEIVPDSTPTTSIVNVTPKATNLDFEK